MANKTIGQLTDAGTLVGTEQIEVQVGAASRRTTLNNVGTLIAPSIISSRDVLFSAPRECAYANLNGTSGGSVGTPIGAAFAGTNGGGVLVPTGASVLRSVYQQNHLFSVSTANLTSGARIDELGAFRKTTAGFGGFLYQSRMGIAVNHAAARFRFGVYYNPGGAIMADNVDPSSRLNLLMFGKDTADTDISFMHNDGAGTATKDSLGVSTAALVGKLLDLTIEVPRAGDHVTWRIDVVDDGTFYTADVTTDLPAIDTLLFPYWQVNSGAGSNGLQVLMNKPFWATSGN